MAREVKEGIQTAPIEEWKNKLGTKAAVYEGLRAFKGWKPGKEVTREVYTEAVAVFCGASMAESGRGDRIC